METYIHTCTYSNHHRLTPPQSDPRRNAKKLPRLLAMDCEMVETKDPLTGRIDAKALARLSVIDGSNPSNVLIDTLVKPYWPVTDYRTRINGITKESLQGCEFTLRHAQKFMSDLCSSETVIAGHAVHNDLISLKMRHFRVVDSAFLYTTVEGVEAGPPSLKDAAKCVLGIDMPASHDSVNDARQSMALLQEYLDAGEMQKPEWKIVRSKKVKGGTYDPDGTNGSDSLFVHRIPIGTGDGKIRTMMINHTSIQPSKMGELVQGTDGGYGKCLVFYDDEKSASLAFEKLKGKTEKDKGGREQKRVFWKSGEYVFVRRNGGRKGKKKE